MYSVNVQSLKKLYFSTITISIIAVVASFILVRKGFYFINRSGTEDLIYWLLIIGWTVLGYWFSNVFKKKKAVIDATEDFDAKVQEYFKFYTLRLKWQLSACVALCCIYIIASQGLFLFMAIGYMIFSLVFHPGSRLLRQELKNNDIVIY